MSWSERRRGLLAALAAAALLAACGFTPLYAPGGPAAAMGGRIEVAVIEGAPGFAMREELTARLGPATAATHRLDVTLALDETGVALTQQDVTTRYTVTGTADYALVPLDGGPPVTGGTVRALTGYSTPETVGASAYASLAAQRDAERRLAVDLADRIVQRLALSAGDWM